MPEVVTLRGGLRAIVSGEHREGFCENCGTRTVKIFYMEGSRKRVQMTCPKCGGQGRLIGRSVSIQPPAAPKCLSPKCLFKFFRDVIFCGVLSNYHEKRLSYAERNRHKEIPGKYRRGEPAPENIRQAIFAIIRLRTRR